MPPYQLKCAEVWGGLKTMGQLNGFGVPRNTKILIVVLSCHQFRSWLQPLPCVLGVPRHRLVLLSLSQLFHLSAYLWYRVVSLALTLSVGRPLPWKGSILATGVCCRLAVLSWQFHFRTPPRMHRRLWGGGWP